MSALIWLLPAIVAAYGLLSPTEGKSSCLRRTELKSLIFQIETLEKIICKECPGVLRSDKRFSYRHIVIQRLKGSIDVRLAKATVIYLKSVYIKCKRVPAAIPVREIICEHKKSTITCSRGNMIEIIKTNYGRTEGPEVCNDGHPSHLKKTNCVEKGNPPSSMKIIKTRCQGKPSCTLHATNGVYKDTCVGTFKYLDIAYKCVKVKPPVKPKLIKRKVDLVVMLDMSVSNDQFQVMKNMMALMEHVYRWWPNQVRVTVVQYGSTRVLIKWFNKKTKLDKLSLKKSSRPTFSGRLKNGIDKVKKYAFRTRYGHRRGARKVVVIVGSTQKLTRNITIAAAEQARQDTNIEFYYIALSETRKVDRKLMKDVAPGLRRSHVYVLLPVNKRRAHKILLHWIKRGTRDQEPVFRFTHKSGAGKLRSLKAAKAVCKELGVNVATWGEIYRAWRLSGLESCSCGWARDGKAYFPVQRWRACNVKTTGKILGTGRRWCSLSRGKGFDVFCSAVRKNVLRRKYMYK